MPIARWHDSCTGTIAAIANCMPCGGGGSAACRKKITRLRPSRVCHYATQFHKQPDRAEGYGMVECKQVVIEYHRAGKSVLFAGHNIASAVKAFRSRYKKASPNTALLIHTRTTLVAGKDMVVGELSYEGTFKLAAIENVAS